MKTIKKILNRTLSFYNRYYGIVSVVFGFLLFSSVENKVLKFLFLGLGIFECWQWYKNYFKNIEFRNRLHSKVEGNSVIAIYGGIRTGKSTLARRLMNVFIKEDKQYFNFKVKGKKALTWRNLLMLDRLEEKCGVMIDECGRQYDSFKYSKDDSDVRSRLVTLNKFFGQFYGTGSIALYVDQSQDNVNTALYRSVYYVIQCCGTRIIPTSTLGYYCFELYKLLTHKKSLTNPFAIVSIEYMDFVKTGDYADHYSINIDNQKANYYVDSIQNMFGHHDTHVFKKYNPAKESVPYIWGTNSESDDTIMEQNFGLEKLQNDFNTNGIDITKV